MQTAISERCFGGFSAFVIPSVPQPLPPPLVRKGEPLAVFGRVYWSLMTKMGFAYNKSPFVVYLCQPSAPSTASLFGCSSTTTRHRTSMCNTLSTRQPWTFSCSRSQAANCPDEHKSLLLTGQSFISKNCWKTGGFAWTSNSQIQLLL
jgi:hypothetical protein